MAKEFSSKESLDDYLKKIQNLKEQERFSGINYQFMLIEEQMIKDFERSISIKHPGDKGTSRENFLRNFLLTSGYLPQKYKVSSGSSHIISTTGHMSNQTDLLIYDAMNTPKLLSLENIQFFPVESVYGIIELKSNLNSKETVFDALNKIKSFKQLTKYSNQAFKQYTFLDDSNKSDGFGIVFSFESALKWETLIQYVEEFQRNNPPNVWPNLIVVLNQGIIGQLKEINQGNIGSIGVFTSKEIKTLNVAKLFGQPQKHSNLLSFYLIIMDLLNDMILENPPLRKYVHLNRPSGMHTYNFGMMADVNEHRNCKKHGDYLRKVSEDNLEKIIKVCQDVEMVSWNDIHKSVYEKDISLSSTKNIKIYNPENYPLKVVLKHPDNSGMLIDELIIDGQKYLIPLYYSAIEKIISECPKCVSAE